MAGMFPTSFTGGVTGSLSVPYSYQLEQTLAENGRTILFYGTECVTFTQPQINALLAEFACLFDKTRWTYQPGMSCNLWGALNKVFGDGGSAYPFVAVRSVNGDSGPNVTLRVENIPGAAPILDPIFRGEVRGPTLGPNAADDRYATTLWVRNAILRAVTNFSIPQATTGAYGAVLLARPQDVANGTPGRVITADQLAEAIARAIGSIDTGGIADAPSDGEIYARRNQLWVAISEHALTDAFGAPLGFIVKNQGD